MQGRRDRLNVESAEEREARLQQMRERLAAESAVLNQCTGIQPRLNMKFDRIQRSLRLAPKCPALTLVIIFLHVLPYTATRL